MLCFVTNVLHLHCRLLQVVSGAVKFLLFQNEVMFVTVYHYACRSSLIYDTGTIKLADFGLSKSLPVNKHASYDLESKFKLTGETGSYRYMAPEVFRHEPYNFKVDVYSFSMIAFQLFEHCPPFAGMDPVEAAKHAALHDRRPAFNRLNDAAAPYPVSGSWQCSMSLSCII